VKTFLPLLLLAATPACAGPPAAAKSPNDADPALWVVKDADTTVYLFGTVHVLKPGLTWFDDAVKTAFDRSDSLVLEIVEPDAKTMGGIVAAKGLAPAGAPPLSQQVPAPKRAAFQRAVSASGVPLTSIDRMKPWLASVTLSVAPLGKLGFEAGNGPEAVLTAAAKQSGKPVEGLETAEQQLGYFDALSNKAQMQFLVSTVDDMGKAGTELDRMVRDWAAGKPDRLGKLLNRDLKDNPEVADALLFRRNARWADWIKARLDRPGTVFVAVGAGHLAGKGDVQEQLAARGVTATRVAY